MPHPQGLLPPLLSSITRAEASRFLAQATFGPSSPAITELVELGFTAWLDTQIALPATHHVLRYQLTSAGDQNRPDLRQEAWWATAVTAPDQLRQRVAFALSEIFVVSDLGGGLGDKALGMTHFYDTLVDGAFGSFRALLEAVSRHPVMAVWLSLAGSTKANPAKGTHPDENYARELMQLFTVGPSAYTQDQVGELARALTGWDVDWSQQSPWTSPTAAVPARHDTGAKSILGGVTVPAGGTPEADLAVVLDTLAAHPGTAPFISRLLIQRLVTSNPTAAYVARVAAVFANDGSGARGNLGAVVRAILLDDEARRGPTTIGPSFGKVREPLLRFTHLWRAFSGSGGGGRWAFSNPEQPLGQAALRATSVFGFFSPDFAAPALAAVGLVAPELQLANDVSLPTADDLLFESVGQQTLLPAPVVHLVGITGGAQLGGGAHHNISVDLIREAALAAVDRGQLLDHLDELLLGGSMPTDQRAALMTYLSGITDAATAATEAVFVVLSSPTYLVQR